VIHTGGGRVGNPTTRRLLRERRRRSLGKGPGRSQRRESKKYFEAGNTIKGIWETNSGVGDRGRGKLNFLSRRGKEEGGVVT